MIDISPSKALSVGVAKDLRLFAIGKGKNKPLTLTDSVLILPKLDGVYAIKEGGKLRTRTMAPFRRELQERFRNVPDGVCGELIVGNRFSSDSWAKTVSDVNKKEGQSEAVLHMFDFATEGSFASRLVKLEHLRSEITQTIEAVVSIPVSNGFIRFDPRQYGPLVREKETLEGLVLRPAGMAYVPSRSTALRPFFMRLKGEETVDGTIIGFHERMHNANEAKETHDGKLRRHSFKENLKPTGMVGSIEVLLPDGRRVMVGTGFDMAAAALMWERREVLKGSGIELKRHEHVRETLEGVKSEQGAYVFIRLREDKRADANS